LLCKHIPSAGLCVRFLLYLTLIIYCPENFIIIFIKKSFPSNRIPIFVFDNRMFERVPGLTSQRWKHRFLALRYVTLRNILRSVYVLPALQLNCACLIFMNMYVLLVSMDAWYLWTCMFYLCLWMIDIYEHVCVTSTYMYINSKHP
jgi:hypothetical protein